MTASNGVCTITMHISPKLLPVGTPAAITVSATDLGGSYSVTAPTGAISGGGTNWTINHTSAEKFTVTGKYTYTIDGVTDSCSVSTDIEFVGVEDVTANGNSDTAEILVGNDLTLVAVPDGSVFPSNQPKWTDDSSTDLGTGASLPLPSSIKDNPGVYTITATCGLGEDSSDFITLSVIPNTVVKYQHVGSSPSFQTGPAAVQMSGSGIVLKAEQSTSLSTYDGTRYTWSVSAPAGSTMSSNSLTQNADQITVNASAFDTAGEYTFTADYDGTGSTGDITVHAVDLAITSLTPSATVELGDDLAVAYTITSPSVSFSSVNLVIENSSGVEIYRDAVSSGDGSQNTTWSDIKWNTGSHSGAFANPKNGPYELKLEGTVLSTDFESAILSVGTKLVIEADITDKKAVGASAASTVSKLSNALKVLLIDVSTTTTVTTSSITLTDITDGKHLKVDGSQLNALSDGAWTIQLKDVRDDIGNFYDADTSTATTDHEEWSIDLY